MEMGILVILVDLQCCRCDAKIRKVLGCLEEEYCIEKVEYDVKNNRVIVRGKFDPEKLCKKIWCKAGKIIKEILIVDVWPPPPPPPPPCKPPPRAVLARLVCVCKPAPPPPPPCGCSGGHGNCGCGIRPWPPQVWPPPPVCPPPPWCYTEDNANACSIM
uniref:HMA domain-containing protein n=1 Tax=Oryza barthii TaxID=65489 RepID=A0A0D3FVD7_9ORYZ